jgi:hypothetical protein
VVPPQSPVPAAPEGCASGMCGFWKARPQEDYGSDADHPPALAARQISADRATFASRKLLPPQKNRCETTFAFSLKKIGKINW